MKISAVVITKNEEKMIANCINTLRRCDEIIVVDNGSKDLTVDIAEREGAVVETLQDGSFAELRNRGAELVQFDWILYIDADERVTPHLKHEISRVVRAQTFDAYMIPRRNIHYGAWMQFGGWQDDTVVRLFRKSALQKWEGSIHEHAEVIGSTGLLHEAVVHLTHRSFMEGMQKTMAWTSLEASLMFDAHHPKMKSWRFFRIFFGALFYRYIWKKGWKDGVRGCIESFTQAMNRFIVYEQLWELQQEPTLEKEYEKIDDDIERLWEKEEQRA